MMQKQIVLIAVVLATVLLAGTFVPSTITSVEAKTHHHHHHHHANIAHLKAELAAAKKAKQNAEIKKLKAELKAASSGSGSGSGGDSQSISQSNSASRHSSCASTNHTITDSCDGTITQTNTNNAGNSHA